MDNIIITKSPKSSKKYRVTYNGKNIDFGATGYNDYILSNGDDVKKNAYIARHAKRENWNNPYTAGFWSRWILWNKPTLMEAINDVSNKLNKRILYYP